MKSVSWATPLAIIVIMPDPTTSRPEYLSVRPPTTSRPEYLSVRPCGGSCSGGGWLDSAAGRLDDSVVSWQHLVLKYHSCVCFLIKQHFKFLNQFFGKESLIEHINHIAEDGLLTHNQIGIDALSLEHAGMSDRTSLTYWV